MRYSYIQNDLNYSNEINRVAYLVLDNLKTRIHVEHQYETACAKLQRIKIISDLNDNSIFVESDKILFLRFAILIRIHMQMLRNYLLLEFCQQSRKYTKTFNHKKNQPDDNFRIFVSIQTITYTRSHRVFVYIHERISVN